MCFFRSCLFLLCCLFRSTPSLLSQRGLHILTKPSLLRREGCNRPPVLFLPHLSLPCGRVLNPLPSPRPFQKGKGCNRPPVLRTATLYGCRTIKGLRHVLRDGTAWGQLASSFIAPGDSLLLTSLRLGTACFFPSPCFAGWDRRLGNFKGKKSASSAQSA